MINIVIFYPLAENIKYSIPGLTTLTVKKMLLSQHSPL